MCSCIVSIFVDKNIDKKHSKTQGRNLGVSFGGGGLLFFFSTLERVKM